MVGELEARRKNGMRSKFIEQAVRNRLDGEEKFDLWDIDEKEILKMWDDVRQKGLTIIPLKI